MEPYTPMAGGSNNEEAGSQEGIEDVTIPYPQFGRREQKNACRRLSKPSLALSLFMHRVGCG